MTLRRPGSAAPATYPQDSGDLRRQREFELAKALSAARQLQARLEMLGDRAADVAVVRSLRDSLARDLQESGRG